MVASRCSDCKDRSKSQCQPRLQGHMVRTDNHLQGRKMRMVQREPCSGLQPVQDFITPCQAVKCFELTYLKHDAPKEQSLPRCIQLWFGSSHAHISPSVLIFYHKPSFDKNKKKNKQIKTKIKQNQTKKTHNTSHNSFPCYKAQKA